MHRRELLRVLGTAAALPMFGALTVEELLAVGSGLHARRRTSGALSFQALTPHEGATVAALAEAIIPETDTAGATAAGVPGFIDLIFGEWYDADERETFRAGLRDVDARSRTAHGAVFIETEDAQRIAVLEELEGEAILLRDSDVDPEPFFKTIKWLTLWGYYTSEEGAIQELNYEIIPGQFNGCAPIVPPEGR